MNTIYEELMNGRVVFKTQDDGTETVERHPPTSKDLRAARAIAQLSNVVQQNNQVIMTLQQQLNKLNELLDKTKEKIDLPITPKVE